ncbi:MAG TPA: NAD-dependent malic enzyme [Phycisphaerae bacterium]|nr:NAD-dependent malic enzyme [Phycisphaerae bacterium]
MAGVGNAAPVRGDAPPGTASHEVLRVAARGQAVLHNPRLNKGTAFPERERRELGLDGLLPPVVATLAMQSQRSYANIAAKTDPLERYIGLMALLDRNETLFYRVLLDHLEEFLPIVYTPTVGLACQRFSRIYRRAVGMWICPEHSGRIGEVLENVGTSDIRLIVATDNERILGLGDLGAGGMGIPVGKLSLYTAGAGIHPRQTLPVSLDVGTDNEELLKDELYVGWRHARLRGKPYDDFIEEFVQAVKRTFPVALLQWEDFKQQNALRLLKRYRNRLPCFNDDIQGTAAIGAAALLAGVRATGTSLKEQRVVMLGAGAAGIGICRLIRDTLQRAGIEGSDLAGRIAMLDSGGMLHTGRALSDETKEEFAWPVERVKSLGLPVDGPIGLEAVVRAFKPTVLVGTSGQPDVFTEGVIRAMAEHVRRPVVLPLSNPTSKCEAKPADVIAWTGGRALVATGSPFAPVPWEGRSIRIGQANNVLIFPGVGLGALVSEASRVTDPMFRVAAETLAAQVSDDDLAGGALFPRLQELRRITHQVACAVVRQAREEGVGRPFEDSDIPIAVRAAMWTPDYPKLEAVPVDA